MKKSLLIIIPALAACSDSIPTVSLGINDAYQITRMTKLPLHPELTGSQYRWYVNNNLVSSKQDYIFIAETEGTYQLRLEIIDKTTPYQFDFTVSVIHEEIEFSPYISEVVEYCPAPGEFINELPPYTPGDSYDDMLKKCTECISGTNDVLVSLGGYGGYITFTFDHTIVNSPQQNDFRIWGNAFYELNNPENKGGSAEPGIVAVSFDSNCNGIPDDEWYEIPGSEHGKPTTLSNYSITYTKPQTEHKPLPGKDPFITDAQYISWTDSQGKSGYIPKNMFHAQSYWPQWISRNQISFTGTLLPPNGVDSDGTGRYYILYAYNEGYVDNHPNDYPELNSFNIENAIDAHGNKANLPGVDFIRVYTAVNQVCGWLGETSTEISRAADLHLPQQ